MSNPLTLVSIGLLLLNDHVLKVGLPSTLTGKLSDFAGLFFFPFLLALFLSVVLDRLRVPAIRTAMLAFSLTFLCFTLIKIWPWANTLAASWLTVTLGLPVQIVLDPTDLMALVVLGPSWRLWTDQNQLQSERSPGLAAYLALGLAAFATLATTCPPPAIVSRLVAIDQAFYASLGGYETAISTDGGQSWSNIQNIPMKSLKNYRKRLPCL